MSRFLNIDEITSHAMTTLKDATNEDRLFFKAWIVAAMRDIGPNKDWIKVCTLFNESGFLKKPDDMVSVIDLALYDHNAKELNYNFNTGVGRIHVDRFTLFDNLSQQNITNRIDLAEEAYGYYLGTNGRVVSYALIRYFAMLVDRDGMPLVEEDNLIAYLMYCRWMWSLRQNDNQAAIAQTYDMWLRERDRVKGKNKMPDSVEAKKIALTWMSLIDVPHRSNF